MLPLVLPAKWFGQLPQILKLRVLWARISPDSIMPININP